MSELDKLLDQMEADPWHVKLWAWLNLKQWQLTCWSRKFWDKSYSGYLLNPKNK